MEIRKEQDRDASAIRHLTIAAFKDVEHSSQTEAAIVDALRGANALTLSLVAVVDERIVGHAAISPVLIDGTDMNWFGLGPVSVSPGIQGKGIGSAVIRKALEQLAQSGASGCVVLGEQEYYGRFGFKTDPRLKLEGVPADYFMCIPMDGETPVGAVTYHPGFDAQ